MNWEAPPLDVRDERCLPLAGDIAFVRAKKRSRKRNLGIILVEPSNRIQRKLPPTGTPMSDGTYGRFGTTCGTVFSWELFVPRPIGRGWWTLRQAKIIQDRKGRWLCDRHTGELVRAASWYLAWLFGESMAVAWPSIEAARDRYELVDGFEYTAKRISKAESIDDPAGQIGITEPAHEVLLRERGVRDRSSEGQGSGLGQGLLGLPGKPWLGER